VTDASRLGPTSYLVLGLLRSVGPSTPYELEQWVDASLGHFWSFPHSQLYAEPSRLAAAGLVHESREASGRRRRTLTVTDAGRRALEEWLAEPVGTPSEIRDLALLKLFFGSAAADPAHVRANAEAQLAAHREKAAVYDGLAAVDGLDPHVAATLRFGRAYEAAAIAFWTSVAEG
jgi:PadR family transcriptional regulator, regulatory protein AphA